MSAGLQSARPVLVTGGCGFIGCNLADALATRGEDVVVYDSFAREGAHENADWLVARHRGRIRILSGDVRDYDRLAAAIGECRGVMHLAAQVAVTTSLEDPRADFEINAGGTLNVLEAVRLRAPEAPVVFASTNKVYGRLFDDDQIRAIGDRCAPRENCYAGGVDEAAPLDFYSPYGCSKGAADQYVCDYGRVYGLATVVLRMSCIYGPRQFGTEDQGWIAHFMRRAAAGEPVTIYGDGRQVRDALHVGDAVRAWIAAFDDARRLSGRAFNLGGGPHNTISLREMLKRLARRRPPQTIDAPPRPGDQKWYVSDTGALEAALGWRPGADLDDGLASLQAWLTQRFGASAPLEGARP